MYEQLEIPGLKEESTAEQPVAQEVLRARRDLVRESNQQRLIDALFERSGRADKSHPLHATYTGLAEAFHLELGRAFAHAAIQSKSFDPEDLLVVVDASEAELAEAFEIAMA